jgi:hypothetical protein
MESYADRTQIQTCVDVPLLVFTRCDKVVPGLGTTTFFFFFFSYPFQNFDIFILITSNFQIMSNFRVHRLFAHPV